MRQRVKGWLSPVVELDGHDWQQKYPVGKIRRKRLDVFDDTYIPVPPITKARAMS